MDDKRFRAYYEMEDQDRLTPIWWVFIAGFGLVGGVVGYLLADLFL